MLMRSVVPTFLAALVLAVPAPAATISYDGTNITVTSGDEAEDFYAGAGGGISFGRNTGGASLIAGSGCTQDTPGEQVSCPMPTKIIAVLGGGNDDVSFDVPVVVEANGGPGGDGISGGTQGDTLVGGLDADYLRGNGGGDTLEGGDGPDTFDLLEGPDDVIGGPGDDYIQFFSQPQGVTVSLDDQANDGPGGSGGANVHSDVEGIQGSPSDDRLTGNAKVNDLNGNGGNDELAGGGGAGSDRISGDAGNDKLDSVNEAGDSLGCGEGTDSIRMDPRDRVDDCESVEVVGPDNDGDGSKPPIDCDDNNASVRPGGNDVPGNGIDEDCSGADAPLLDADQDGSVDAADCDDANPAIRPGAVDRPGNGVDEDCDGADDPYPLILGSIVIGSSGTKITLLRVSGAPPGARVQVRCRGRGCPFRRKSLRLRNGRVTGTRIMRGRRLGRGAVLEVRLTARDTIGKVIRLTVRPSGKLRRQSLCLRPGAGSPHAC